MKTRLTLLLTLLATCFAGPLFCRSAPVGTSNSGRNYLFMLGEASLQGWVAGLHGSEVTRDIEITDTDVITTMDQTKLMAFVGFHPVRWLMVYGTVGQSENAVQILAPPDYELEYGGGAQLNLFDHEIPDPPLMINRLRLNVGLQGTVARAEWPAPDAEDEDKTEKWEWNEYLAYATLGLVNDVEGSKSFWPNSIGLYAGPAFSMIDADDFEQDGSQVGYFAGIELFFTDSVSATVGLQSFSDWGYEGGIQLNF